MADRSGASILVPVLDEAAHVRDAVATMCEQRFDGSLEVLLIDGGSTDGTREVLADLARADPRIVLLDNPARRTPNALNIGLGAARGEYVVRMDAHSAYPPTYVRDGVARLQRGDVAWVAGPQVPAGTDRWSRRVASALASAYGRGASNRWGRTGEDGVARSDEFDLDTGVFCGVWRRADLEAWGGWDEGWPINQDSELAARVLAAGGRIVCLPEMAARYVPRNSLPALARQYFRYGLYRAKTSRRHPHSLRRSHLLAPVLAVGAVAAALPGPGGRAARRGLLTYAVITLLLGARATASPRESVPVAAVFATMHLAFGCGFLVGCGRFGPPVAALRRVAGGTA